MKKCSFLSPEALLQAEIFGSGNSGGGGTSSIVDVSDQIYIYQGGESTQSIMAYFDDNVSNGIFLIRFTANYGAYIELRGAGMNFDDFLSSYDNTEITNAGKRIVFNDIASSEQIYIAGRLMASSR